MKRSFFIYLLMFSMQAFCMEEITPCKLTGNNSDYEIPPSARFTVKQSGIEASEIVYYFSKPKEVNSYPIAILCGGSSTPDNLQSIIHFHRHLLQEFLDLNVGVITIEQRGIDGNKVDSEVFYDNYTRSNRLHDHETVIEHLKKNPLIGWNGKFIFLGVSEGGPIVTSLTERYQDSTLATINWCGIGDWPWREELWSFMQKLIQEDPECPHDTRLSVCDICLEHFSTRDRYDACMDAILCNPVSDKYFMCMTYKYHADAMLYPKPCYEHMGTPYLAVVGAKDTIIQSGDAFIEKAKNAGANITYWRIEEMDHYIRYRPDLIAQSFVWLQEQLINGVSMTVHLQEQID